MAPGGGGVGHFPRTELEFDAVRAAKRHALSRDPMMWRPEDFPQVREDVLMSWKRSALARVDPQAAEFPRDPGFASSSRLSQVAQPIMDRLADQISDLSAWGFLVDRGCRLLTAAVGDAMQAQVTSKFDAMPGRCFSEELIGTNGIGCAHELQRTFVVAGPEHFRRSDEVLTTVGVVIRDPFTQRQVGTLGIACRHQYASAATVPLAEEFGRAIETQLGSTRSDVERAAFDEFLRLSSRSRGAVVAVGPDLFVANGRGRELVHDADHDMLTRIAEEWLGAPPGREVHRRLSSGAAVRITLTPIGNRVSGYAAVMNLHEVGARAVQLDGTPQPFTAEGHGTLLRRALRQHGRVLVTGEHGVGKRHAALAALAELDRDEIVELDGALAATPGWAEKLEQATARPEATVLLTHLDDVPAAAQPLVAGLLAGARAWVAATASDDVVGPTPAARVREAIPVVVAVPALRDRIHEVKKISAAILAELRAGDGRDVRLSARALSALHAVDWHGNIRQLAQVLATSRLRATGGEIQVHDLPPRYSRHEHTGFLTRLEQLERRALAAALSESDGNREEAAARLGISRATVYRRIKLYGLH
ncbi:MAG TPA: helix-turn-helix domain-containing protein [Actinomycetaceae bacterium]|nr:helix-turn-helix domain-containing protein [Actinomycetaceae bacterium]